MDEPLMSVDMINLLCSKEYGLNNRFIALMESDGISWVILLAISKLMMNSLTVVQCSVPIAKWSVVLTQVFQTSTKKKKKMGQILTPSLKTLFLNSSQSCFSRCRWPSANNFKQL